MSIWDEEETPQSAEQLPPTSAQLLKENAQLYAERASMLDTLDKMEKTLTKASQAVKEQSKLAASTTQKVLSLDEQIYNQLDALQRALPAEISRQSTQVFAGVTQAGEEVTRQHQERLEGLFKRIDNASSALAAQRVKTARIRDWTGTALLMVLAVLVPVVIVLAFLTGPTDYLTNVATWLGTLWPPAAPLFQLVVILALIALPTWAAWRGTRHY